MTVDGSRAFRRVLEERVPELSAPERRAAFLGLLEEHLPDAQPILVGGALVELLTEGTYVTGDVDLVGDAEAIGRFLEEAGFEREGRHLVDEELGLVVEIVAPHLEPERRTERIRWREHTLHVLSLEDLVVDRLCAAKFWGSTTDREQAILLLSTHRERVDRERLRRRAEAEDVADVLDEVEEGSGME